MVWALPQDGLGSSLEEAHDEMHHGQMQLVPGAPHRGGQ